MVRGQILEAEGRPSLAAVVVANQAVDHLLDLEETWGWTGQILDAEGQSNLAEADLGIQEQDHLGRPVRFE